MPFKNAPFAEQRRVIFAALLLTLIDEGQSTFQEDDLHAIMVVLIYRLHDRLGTSSNLFRYVASSAQFVEIKSELAFHISEAETLEGGIMRVYRFKPNSAKKLEALTKSPHLPESQRESLRHILSSAVREWQKAEEAKAEKRRLTHPA